MSNDTDKASKCVWKVVSDNDGHYSVGCVDYRVYLLPYFEACLPFNFCPNCGKVIDILELDD